MSIMSSMLWPAREDWRIQLRMADVAEVDLLMRPIVKASVRLAIPGCVRGRASSAGRHLWDRLLWGTSNNLRAVGAAEAAMGCARTFVVLRRSRSGLPPLLQWWSSSGGRV